MSTNGSSDAPSYNLSPVFAKVSNKIALILSFVTIRTELNRPLIISSIA
jgi:hypothetical protein